MAGSFEEALNIAASSTALQGTGSGSAAVVIDRNGVTGAAWLDPATQQSICTWDMKWPEPGPDLFWWTQAKDSNDGTTLTWFAGIDFDWAFFNDATKPWQVFVNKSAEILHPLASWPYENDSYSPNSVTYGANMITGLNQLLEKWIPQFKSWADAIDVPDGDFQGSAAGVLKHRVIEFQNQLQSISDQLTNPDLAGELNTVAGNMAQVARNLSQAYDDWLSGVYWTPGAALQQRFTDAIEHKTITLASNLDGVPITEALKVSTPYGDPMTPGFWSAIENAAKADWLAGLAGLDASATNFISTLTSAYTQAAAVLPPVIVSPPPQVNASGSGNNPFGDGNFDLNKIFSQGSSGGKVGGNFKLPGSKTSGKSGGSNMSLTGGGNSGQPFPNPGADARRLTNLFSGSGSGPGSGSGTPPPHGLNLLGSGGSGGQHDTITGPDGTRYTVPPGSTIGPDGLVVGPDGKPVLGKDGKQVKVPKGSKITAGDSLGDESLHQDSLLGPDGKPVLGPDGKQLKVPSGTTVRPDGSVVGPDGKPLLGGNGKPLTVPKGSYLTQSGLSGNGPSSSTKFPHDDFQVTGSGGLRGLNRLTIGGPGGPSGTGGLTLGGGGGPSSMGGLRNLSSGMGLSDRARELIDPEGRMGLTTNRQGAGPGNQALEEMAEEEARMGRVSTVGGSGANEGSMMPPMAGGMGGMGGGGGAGAGPRKAWVTEDEETWGTASTGTKGAIGR